MNHLTDPPDEVNIQLSEIDWSKWKERGKIAAVVIWIGLGIYGFFFITILRDDNDRNTLRISSLETGLNCLVKTTQDNREVCVPLGNVLQILLNDSNQLRADLAKISTTTLPISKTTSK